MNLNTLVNYKHSMFHVSPVSTIGVKIIKSRHYAFTWYAVKNDKLLCVLDTTIAHDSWVLWKSIKGELNPSKNDISMYEEEEAPLI